jgi:LysR family transcriptional regulator, nitrogen assimilation regulatory protein
MPVDVRALRCFVAVASAGSISRAAEVVHLAQPALSLQIKNLEEELGVVLFERTPKGVVLTESGHRFLAHARDILRRLDFAFEDIRAGALNPSGNVAIGFSQSVARLLTVPLVRETLARWPDVRLQIVEMSTGYIPENLRNGHLDVGMTFKAETSPGLHFEHLIDEILVLIGPPGSLSVLPAGGPQALAQVDASRIAAYPLILPAKLHGLRALIDDTFASKGIQCQVIAEVNAIPELIQLAAAGVGHSILSLGAVSEELRAGVLSAARIHPAITRPVYLARATTRPQTAAVSVVLELMATLVRELVADGAWPAMAPGRA